MADLIYKEESYIIIGICMEVHQYLGPGFLEIVYKDALEYEFKKVNINFSREKEYLIHYKEIILAHKYYADFVVLDKIILEIKSCKALNEDFIGQTLNYLSASGLNLGLIVNFGEKSLNYKRVIL
jgi:GxxExxY protein